MNNDEPDAYSSFRRIGSKGLVIFQRDGTLMRPKSSARNFMLGDISHEFVQILTQLRELSIRFGFLSNNRGMDAGSHGRTEFASLREVLDRLLSIQGALPDFWMAIPQRTKRELQGLHARRQRVDAGMILQAIEWYGVTRKETVFVSRFAPDLRIASEVGVEAIQFSGLRNDQKNSGQMGMVPQHPPTPQITELQRLGAQIQTFLGVGHSHSP